MSNDLISREALKKAIDELFKSGGYDSGLVMNTIDNAPTVEVDKLILIVAKRHGKREMMLNALRPHGEWLKSDIPESVLVKCSICGFDCGAYTHNFCPNCGAKMEGGKEE